MHSFLHVFYHDTLIYVIRVMRTRVFRVYQNSDDPDKAAQR